jgi:cytidine diphosphoramidate kinase
LTVFWITGLPGAGKTTIARQLYEILKVEKRNVVLLDGDQLRKVFADETNYDYSSRKNLAQKYSRLCKYLSDQGHTVIIATVSMFHDIRDWNRKNINSYAEVYIKVPIEILAERDQKNLYSMGMKGEVNNVLGIDVEIEEPMEPDVILNNDGAESLPDLVQKIIAFINKSD